MSVRRDDEILIGFEMIGKGNKKVKEINKDKVGELFH
jgi:hypothetical protein